MHWIAQIHFKLIVANVFVFVYVPSPLSLSNNTVTASSLTHDTLKTVVSAGAPSKIYGSVTNVLSHRYKVINLVLKHIIFGVAPKNGLYSQHHLHYFVGHRLLLRCLLNNIYRRSYNPLLYLLSNIKYSNICKVCVINT